MTQSPEYPSHPSSQEYLSVLNPRQKEAVMHHGSPLLILAGAGSGKTRVITTKIAYLISEKNVDPYSILAVTFTKKAAQEMSERAHFLEPRSSKAHIRTFHSFGSWFLRQYYLEAGIDAHFTVYDDEDSATLLHKACPNITRQEAKLMASKIALAKDYCYTPESPELSLMDDTGQLALIYKAYQERLSKTGNIDFGDLIMLPVLLMRDNEKIRQHMHRRFSVIMVDEYQDSNVAQFMLLQNLAGLNTYVCVVGDDDQSIYSFRGAEVQNILTFPNHFPGTQVIKLEQNYRSTPEILAVANDSISHNTDRFEKQLEATRNPGDAPVITFLDNQDDEVAFCADLIKKSAKRGVPYQDWAILYRTNAQSMGFETTFLHQQIPYTIIGALKFYDREEVKDILALLALTANPKDEIAFRRIVNKPSRGIGETTQEKIVKFAKDNENNPEIQGSFLAACKEGAGVRSAAKKNLKEFASMMETFVSMIDIKQDLPLIAQQLAQEADDLFAGSLQSTEKQKTSTESASVPISSQQHKTEEKLSFFIQYVCENSGLIEYHTKQDEISGTQRVMNLQELANSAVLYPMTMDGLLDFLDHVELDRTLENRAEENTDAVTLITVHNTKGLEFPRVILTGMEDNLFPRSNKYAQELEEERRLFYVGVTRAQNQLILTSCRKRLRFGRTEEMFPSIFLTEIKPHHVKMLGDIPYMMRSPQQHQETSHPLAQKWKKGKTVFHDDFGYGVVINTRLEEEEFVVLVQFQTGGEKQFMPEYQKDIFLVED